MNVQYVVKLYGFVLHTKNLIIDAYYIRRHHIFQCIIVLFSLKILKIDTNLECVFKVNKITIYTKDSCRIMYGFHRGASKALMYSHLLFRFAKIMHRLFEKVELL